MQFPGNKVLFSWHFIVFCFLYRRPIVLVEKLPVAVTHGLRQSGDSPSGQPGRKVLKRKVSPGPSRYLRAHGYVFTVPEAIFIHDI